MYKDITILGIQMDLGMTYRGADSGSQAIRRFGLLAELNSCFLNICNYGDFTSKVSTQLNQDNSFDIDMDNLVSDFEAVAKTVAQIVEERSFPIILGGDHSISVGTIPGISKNYNNLGVIWFDDHAGVRTPCKKGLPYHECIEAMRVLSCSELITSAEITELNPIFDKGNKTSKIAVSLIRTLLQYQAAERSVK